jgi:hypothetical protein
MSVNDSRSPDDTETTALRKEVQVIKRCLAYALAELCRISSNCPSDVNGEIWEAFDEMGGNAEALRAQIKMFSSFRSLSLKAMAGGAE